jgi:AraC-like DNA-binding protein
LYRPLALPPLPQLLALIEQHGSISAAARQLDCSSRTVRRRLQAAGITVRQDIHVIVPTPQRWWRFLPWRLAR